MENMQRLAIPSRIADWEDLGGRVTRTREEMKHSVFFFAYSAFDVDFISVQVKALGIGKCTNDICRFYDGTYRVLDKRFIYDGASLGYRPPEDDYAYAVSKGGRIVPAHRRIPWEGFLGQPKPVEKPKKKRRKRDVGDVGGRAVVTEAEEAGILGGLARFVTGLMTPAASIVSQAEKKSH
ncbi:hypothetical protein C8R44DRAFT_753961 [Mycena epipterygia]|nr:hypothetical protein C8R44DRAFT_753961 [Mycena epipterygia]